MIYLLNKIAYAMVSPLSIGLLLLIIATILLASNFRKKALVVLISGIFWFYLWSTPLFANWLGAMLELRWQPTTAESIQCADAIVLLGGGMIDKKEGLPYPNLLASSDRVWYASLLYRAGKAPIIIPTGTGVQTAEKILLKDFGVAEDAIVCECAARNTEENARKVEELIANSGKQLNVRKILLVTSALHMSRSMIMFERYAPTLEIIAAPCDYEYSARLRRKRSLADFVPTAFSLSHSTYILKEYIGILGYRLFR